MTNKKSTKRALLMSALSLLMCVSMLIGSTFAWFTDSVTSSGNKIVAGTLEVDLLMADADGKYTSIADKDAAIFGAKSLVAQNNAADTLWEPGKTQIVYLGVENKGNLDLKYNILLNVIDGGLIGSLEYAIVDGVKADDALDVDDWAAIKALAQSGNIAAGTTVAAPNGAIKAGENAIDYFALAVHMKEEAGNQYQGKDITIDVTVVATQLASESDSFDNLYDVMSTYLNQDAEGNWLIGSAGDLAYFAASVNGGNKYNNETVKLIADIDLAKYNWLPIGSNDVNYFSGNFDGQGYTISNLYVNAATTDNVGLFGSVRDGASIKNVTINNANVTGRAKVGALVGLAYSGVAIDNCHATGNINVTGNYKVGGLVGGDYFTMTNCSIGAAATTFGMRSTPAPTAFVKAVYLKKDLEGDCAGGLAGFVAEGSGVMSDNSAIAVVEGSRKVGGVFGYVGYSRTVKNCSFTGAVSTNASAEYITANAGKISVGGVIGEMGTDKGTVILEGNTIGAVTLNGAAEATTGAIVGNDRHGKQKDQVASLNSAASENAEIAITATVAAVDELQEALEAGKNVVLADDIICENTTLAIASGKEVTIDLNGKTLAGVNTVSGSSALIRNNGTLNITGNGTITVLAENPDTDWNPEGFPTYASNTIANLGNLTIGEGVRIENQTATGGASYAIDNYAGAALTINGGEIIQTGGDIAIRMNTASATAENKVVINGGTISGRRAIWIQLAGSSTATAPKTTLEINGGNLSGTQQCIYSYSYGNSFANTKVTITGGTFNGDVQFGGGYKGDRETITVTGGTFNGELGRWVTSDEFQPLA